MAVAFASLGVEGSAQAARADLVATARVIATGIPGAGAVAPVGTFLPASPISANPVFAAYTQPGRVLDPTRIFVGSTSNFGAEKARADQAEGSFLTIDRLGANLRVPAGFAAAGDQASALNGAVQMFSAQSPNWVNKVYSPGAATADEPGASNPLGMSINNAFGRPWPSNAPYGLSGPGSSSVLDPDGRPLNNAPNPAIGGVFLGGLTNRQPQVTPGTMATGAVSATFLGPSPDGTGKAVFAVVLADGSVVQQHVAKGLDGLWPAGTVHPLQGRRWLLDRKTTPRLGALLSYEPNFSLYISQPFDDSIKVLDLQTSTGSAAVFTPTTSRVIRSAFLNQPVDLAPARPETAHPLLSSNTTMSPGSDIYVANRGNCTVARIRQNGSLAAIRWVNINHLGCGLGHLNGIATAPDGSKIWLTLAGPVPGTLGQRDALIEIPAF
ncbi:hypothetical protein GCM10009555_069030 [Acrocarpospora macrocephala]|uniref:Uncharacterized protein n=1 Tax=Acrocarpospora macrocephala TaxID=150177 RepID=A0A5M3X922_9ACTN|nr:hypothetical protein Amac_096190 [Acrocarpospora macrocephala]